ncbi:MAG: MiaB/RimO family radical SAM methylthiotransferase [Deltaproteobacteria bacterium]
MTRKPAVGILSLGCSRNLVDSELLLGRLSGKGFRVTDLQKAEIGVVNTCAFVQDAKTESIEAIAELVELKKAGRLKKIIVCGCLVQRYGEELRKGFPEVDAFIGSPGLDLGKERYALTPASYAYLKICEGCVNKCSFCAVPGIKPRLESLEEKQVIEKLAGFDRQGIPEIDIIGQDITGYGLDRGPSRRLHTRRGLDRGGEGLARIVSLILKKSKFSPRWFRLLYLHPARVSDKLLRLVRDDPRMCKYIDLPLQHINDRVLKAMNRHTSKADILRLLERVRGTIPGVAVRTAFIVGFPGETDKEFEELLSFIREARFERLGCFIYSREEGTAAASMKGQVPEKVKQERLDRVMRLQQDISREHNAALMGRTLDVLIDEEEDGRYLGRTQADAPEVDGSVFVSSKRRLKTGEMVRARVTDTLEYDICAEVEDEHPQ